MKKLLVLLLFIATFSHAEPVPEKQEDTEKYTQHATMAVSAFECSLIASTQKESKRLLAVGVKAGRAFLELFTKDKKLYAKTIKTNKDDIPSVWGLYSEGPSPDFILGQLYEHIKEKGSQKLPKKDNKDDVEQLMMFREKNCALLGK